MPNRRRNRFQISVAIDSEQAYKNWIQEWCWDWYWKVPKGHSFVRDWMCLRSWAAVKTAIEEIAWDGRGSSGSNQGENNHIKISEGTEEEKKHGQEKIERESRETV